MLIQNAVIGGKNTDILIENGKITEDEFSGGFVGFKYLDTIADPCV